MKKSISNKVTVPVFGFTKELSSIEEDMEIFGISPKTRNSVEYQQRMDVGKILNEARVLRNTETGSSFSDPRIEKPNMTKSAVLHDSDILGLVNNNKNLTPKELSNIHKDVQQMSDPIQQKSMLSFLAGHPNTPQALIHSIVKQHLPDLEGQPDSIRSKGIPIDSNMEKNDLPLLYASANPRTHKKTLDLLSTIQPRSGEKRKGLIDYLHQTLAGNPNASPEALTRLADEETTHKNLLAREDTPTEAIAKITKSIRDYYPNHEARLTPALLHKNAPPQEIADYAADYMGANPSIGFNGAPEPRFQDEVNLWRKNLQNLNKKRKAPRKLTIREPHNLAPGAAIPANTNNIFDDNDY